MAKENNNLMPVMGHVDEFVRRARRAVIWFILGALVAYGYTERVILILETPLLERLPEGAKLIFTAPFEKMWVHLRVSVLLGALISIPAWGWELYRFFYPALKATDRKRIRDLLLTGGLAILVGLLVGYRWVLPMVIDTIFRFGGDGVETAMLTVSTYINMTLGLLLFSAIVFLLPIAMVLGSLWGWVAPQVWKSGRKVAIVANSVVSAILSPPDVLSMILMMIPIHFLYEIGVIGASVAQWTKLRGRKID